MGACMRACVCECKLTNRRTNERRLYGDGAPSTQGQLADERHVDGDRAARAEHRHHAGQHETHVTHDVKGVAVGRGFGTVDEGGQRHSHGENDGEGDEQPCSLHWAVGGETKGEGVLVIGDDYDAGNHDGGGGGDDDDDHNHDADDNDDTSVEDDDDEITLVMIKTVREGAHTDKHKEAERKRLFHVSETSSITR